MTTPLPKESTLFEASWEVCNKVGGIHTVLTTKIASAQATFSHYYTLGPWLAENPTFHETPIPAEFTAAVAQAGKQGVVVHYGRWLTDGQPSTFLVDWQGLLPQSNALKTKFWEKFKLDTLHTDFYDVDQPLLWSTAVGIFIACIAETEKKPLLFHGHEWLSAGAFLTLADNPLVHTVFTTHATVLGRALSSAGSDLQSKLATVDPDKEAAEHQVTTKHQLERLAAQHATVFTTVSDLTGREATALLGRKPDIITENGFDPELFPPFDTLCIQHQAIREELHNFTSAYFFPSYQFDLSQTSYLFSMGRYEMHNKGFEIFLAALGKLNEQLQKAKSDRTVIACLFVPGDVVGVRAEVNFQIQAHRHIVNILSNYTTEQQRELYHDLWQTKPEECGLQMLPPHTLDQIKQFVLRMPHHLKVPVSPFELKHPDQDAILQAAALCNLHNTKADRVKVLFFPAYFDGFDGIFNKSLYEIISGCDLGVFPSFYEPWGYTPMECFALGIPAITSDLAGFGLAIKEYAPAQASLVLPREGHTDSEAANALTSLLSDYLQQTPREQLGKRMSVYQASEAFSWKFLYGKYQQSYQLALK